MRDDPEPNTFPRGTRRSGDDDEAVAQTRWTITEGDAVAVALGGVRSCLTCRTPALANLLVGGSPSPLGGTPDLAAEGGPVAAEPLPRAWFATIGPGGAIATQLPVRAVATERVDRPGNAT
jgi:hypothetical protein